MESVRTILVSVMRTTLGLIVLLNAVNGTATITELVITQMDYVNAIHPFSDNFVKIKNVLMIALEKDFVIGQKENAFAMINGMVKTALQENVLMIVQEMVNV
jgi:hypothetical protein